MSAAHAATVVRCSDGRFYPRCPACELPEASVGYAVRVGAEMVASRHRDENGVRLERSRYQGD